MTTTVPNDSPDVEGRILDAMGVAVLAVDAQSRLIRVNRRARELTGLQREGFLGLPCFHVVDASLCKNDCPLQAALRTGTSSRYGTVVVRPNPNTVALLEMTASAIVDDAGQVSGAVALLRDARSRVSELRCYGSRIFVSCTPAMRSVFDALPRLAESKAPILIIGARGAGRAALAETIHGLGTAQAMTRLYTVQCGAKQALSRLETVLERAHRARSSTLLLEDIQSAPSELQCRLLMWLEEQSARTIRLISTALPDLDNLLVNGAFRRDLFHRLGVLHVALPGLQQRRQDIPLLAQQFIDELNAIHGKNIQGMTPHAFEHLHGLELPENVRGLRALITKAYQRCTRVLIDVDNLAEPQAIRKRHIDNPEQEQCASWRQQRDGIEKQLVTKAIADAGGNLTKAASVLHMHRSTLWRKAQRYELLQSVAKTASKKPQ